MNSMAAFIPQSAAEEKYSWATGGEKVHRPQPVRTLARLKGFPRILKNDMILSGKETHRGSLAGWQEN
jgi:hypothetical protein